MDGNGLPDDWDTQVARAYATFGVDPLDGATEFGRLLARARGRALGHVKRALRPGLPDFPLNLSFERLHPRDQIGRFKEKPRARRKTEKNEAEEGKPGSPNYIRNENRGRGRSAQQ